MDEALVERDHLTYINLCLMRPEACWWQDDPNNLDCFFLYFQTPAGQISYCLPQEYMKYVIGKIDENPEGRRWDNHSLGEINRRLVRWADMPSILR